MLLNSYRKRLEVSCACVRGNASLAEWRSLHLLCTFCASVRCVGVEARMALTAESTSSFEGEIGAAGTLSGASEDMVNGKRPYVRVATSIAILRRKYHRI